MAWLTDARRYDDAWWGSLTFGARILWDACLTGQFRTALPGLCRGVSLLTLHDACTHLMPPEKRPSVEETERYLAEALEPDLMGKVHFILDPVARVARIPMAPAYNHADNPNVLTSWYRHWREIPDCDLKFQHIESLRLGVNFSYIDKHKRASMSEKWEATFGQPERAYRDGGKKLKTYVDLQERWVDGGGQEPESSQATLPFGSKTAAAPELSLIAGGSNGGGPSLGGSNGSQSPASGIPAAASSAAVARRPRLPPGVE